VTEHRIDRVERLVDLGRHREALTLADQMLGEHPDDVRLLGVTAQAHLGLGAHRSALELADLMVSRSPDDDWAHRLRANALVGLGRDDEATAAAHEAVRLAPLAWEAHAQYADVAPAELSRWPDPRLSADRAVELAPQEPDTHFAVALVAQRQGRRRAARASYRRVLALDPEHAPARNNLTVLTPGLRLGRSADELADALRLAPQEEVVRSNIDWLVARLLLRLGLAAVTALVLAVLLAYADGRPPQRTPGTILVVVALLGGGTTYVVALGRRMPRGVRQVALGILGRDGPVPALALAVLVVVVLTVLVALVPSFAVYGPHLVGFLAGPTACYLAGSLLRLLAGGLRRVLLPTLRRLLPRRS
jgi:Flp pilus assembly protein TadD